MKTVVKTISTAVLIGALSMFCGCQKQEPVKPKDANAAAASAGEQVIEQKTCPVMGGDIDKAIYAEYKGKKVYFCCAGCKPVFEKDPEKYVGKLPQFAK